MKTLSNTILIELVFLTLTAMFLTSCSSSKSNITSDSNINYPKDLIIEIGSGGGFTGKWAGYSLLDNGKIISWNGNKQGANPKDYQKLDQKTIQFIWQKIIDSKVLDIKLQEPGNMSKSIKIMANGKLYFFVWDYSRKDNITNDLNILYQFIFNTLEKK